MRTGNFYYPTYERPIYFNGQVEMTQEIFDELVNNIHIEKVFTNIINGVSYDSYSQAVPAMSEDAVGLTGVKYMLIFMIESESSYADEQLALIDSDFSRAMLIIELIICSGFFCALLCIQVLVYKQSRPITRAIDTMTRFTNLLKQAPDVQSKRQIIDRICNDPEFIKVNNHYEKMKKAKDSLVKRHEEFIRK